MTLKHILYILPLFILFSCNNGTQKENTVSKDSIYQTSQIDSAVRKELNKYLIEPPDTNYTGDHLSKWENGNTKFKGFFRFGKRHGEWLAFYANGVMWSQCFYNKGLREGANNVFFENGKQRYKGWYKNDLREGEWIFYDESGAEIRRITFKEDKEVTTSK